MGILFTIICKDWKLLLKDKVGLLILFILPICLLILVSFTQQSLYDSKLTIRLLVLNQDKGKVGEAINKALNKKSDYKITFVKKSNASAIAEAKDKVAKGDYHAFIVIPKDASFTVRHHFLTGDLSTSEIALYLDPAMLSNMAKNLKLGIDYLFQSIALNSLFTTYTKMLHKPDPGKIKSPFKITEHYASQIGARKIVRPNSVQQNVPAWTLFGMFFIVIPLAGQMVQERHQGVIDRLKIAPVSPLSHFLGRSIAYLMLNLIQMSLMLLVGVFLLPHLGLPALNTTGNLGLFYVVGFFASLAAIGFGILIGTWANTPQQTSIFAPFIIVIVASISGIFFPIYTMPKAITLISEWSPIYWAQMAFLDICVRGEGFQTILPNLLKLLGFFVLMLILSLPPITRLKN